MTRIGRAALLAVLIVTAGGCGGDSTSAPKAPSPAAMAEPPTEEALERDALPPFEQTRARFREAMAFAKGKRLAERPIGEVMVALGETFLGRPYIIGPLDGFGREVIVARLDSFDCFTYVEALLAMARGVVTGDTTFADYFRRTEEQRYRDGQATGYASRLHYFTDWIHTNVGRGLVRDVTAEAGGEPFEMRYGFMTVHREAYPALAVDSTFRQIARMEDRLNEEADLFYIPQDRIAASYGALRPGDLIATVTDIEWLDVTHTGLVFKGEDGLTGLLHASTFGGVKISPDLQAYVEGVKKQVGIIVARPLDPRGR